MIVLEQAVFHRRDGGPALMRGRSPGFRDDWFHAAEEIVVDFGDRPSGVACPLSVFAVPLTRRHAAIVRVVDRPGHEQELAFHVMVVARRVYEEYLGDPFQLADKLPPSWEADGALPPLTLPGPLPTPTVAEITEILRRVKASALREGEDPEKVERTITTAESPALLGAAQVLVDGGRVLFRRPGGDLRLVSGLWPLLPVSTRGRLWPASFAFCNRLDFDVVVLPQLEPGEGEGYLTEEQAADYPQGRYELALQLAVESGSQEELDQALSRRDSGEVLRRTFALLVVVAAIVVGGQWLGRLMHQRDIDPAAEERAQAAVAAGIAASGDPWTALGFYHYGKARWGRR